MACRGVHFAISNEDVDRLTSAKNDKELLVVVQEEIEQRWDQEWLYESDKAWDAIHRCLTDGRIRFENGEYPYGLCILGGKQLHSADNYIVSLKTPREVSDIAKALSSIQEETLRKRYFAIEAEDYGQPLSSEGFAYTWEYYSGLSDFFSRAAAAGRHVIFTVDQ